MPRKRKSRIYTRMQGGQVRYYADFRDFADVGGKREALIPKGADRATTDEKLAQALVAARLEELEARRRRKQRGEPEEEAYLISYAAYHLQRKARSTQITDQWLEAVEKHLLAAIEFFCNGGRPVPLDRDGKPILDGIEDRPLESIGVGEVSEYVEWLASRSNGRGGQLSPSSQRKYLNSLSNLYNRAIGERRVPPGYNPVQGLMDKPQDWEGRHEANWLEVHEAALLLESARLYRPQRPEVGMPPGTIYALIATFLLTGGRPAEVYGLRVEDVSFDRKTITFRPNETRRLKTSTSWRTVPLWPQLEEILREYLAGAEASRKTGLLFPSVRTGQRIRDIRKALDAIAVRVGWNPGDIRPYAFRHTYCAARLQTLDKGAPVSVWTVARELGHGGRGLVDRVYGHLGEVRHRSDVVEYRVEQHKDKLGDRLAKLYGSVDQAVQ